jgi:hypothetical protein
MLCVTDGEFCDFDPFMLEILLIIIEISVLAVQQKLAKSIDKNTQSIVYESVALCCENQAERINTCKPSEEYLEFLEFTAGGLYNGSYCFKFLIINYYIPWCRNMAY